MTTAPKRLLCTMIPTARPTKLPSSAARRHAGLHAPDRTFAEPPNEPPRAVVLRRGRASCVSQNDIVSFTPGNLVRPTTMRRPKPNETGVNRGSEEHGRMGEPPRCDTNSGMRCTAAMHPRTTAIHRRSRAAARTRMRSSAATVI